MAKLSLNIELYGMLCDRLGRLFGRLGLKRRPKDTTPTIADIVARHRAEDAAAAAASEDTGEAAE